MKNISVIAIRLSPGDDEILVRWFDSLHYLDKSLNLNIFTSGFNINQPQKKFTVLPLYEAKYYDGIVFAWDLLSLELCLSFPNIKHIFYYLNQNLPWTNSKNIFYQSWANMFDNPNVSMIVTDSTVEEICSLTWKKPILINDMSPETLYEILR